MYGNGVKIQEVDRNKKGLHGEQCRPKTEFA
jgi:hypothetical protein